MLGTEPTGTFISPSLFAGNDNRDMDDAVSPHDSSLAWRIRKISVPSGTVLVPLAAILVAEGLLFFGYTWYSLWAHLATLLLTTLAPLRYETETPTLRAFALVPLFRLVNLGMPVFFQLTVYWFPLIYGPLVPALYMLVRGQQPVDPDLRWKRATLLFAPLALLLAEVEYAIIRPEALIPAWTPTQLGLITVVMVGFVGLVEELLFRGVLQRTLQSRLGRWTGLALASAVFGLMHSGYNVPAELAFAGAIGFVFGLIYDWTDSIALVTVIHGLLNVFLFAVIPMQGSLLARLLTAVGLL